jgi:hypothetical protein
MVWNMVKSIHVVHWNCTPECPHSGAPKRYSMFVGFISPFIKIYIPLINPTELVIAVN